MKPSRIITDPKRLAEIISNQPRVSRERAIRSILSQNGFTPTQIERRLEALTQHPGGNSLKGFSRVNPPGCEIS